MKRSAAHLQRFRPPSFYINTLPQWIEYASKLDLDCPVDLYTYISKGHAIFAAHQQKLYDYPANYLHFLFDRSVDKASHDNTRVNLAQTKEVDEFLHATSCAYMALESLIIDNHADVHGQCEKSRGSFGWSPITQLFHIACIFRFHLELVERLIYTLRDNDTRVVQSLKHIRHVPRTMAIADLCQATTTTTTTLAPNSSILSASTEALLSNQTPLHNAAHEPMATRSTTSILPRQMCPLSLLHSANSLCPSIVCMGCVLYPDVQFGHYSQFQVYEQMSFISQRMYDIDITHNELVPFMRALHLRMCELLHFTYFAKCAWSPTALPNEISPSKPLDMLPPERYRLAHRFGGVPPQERSMTVDLSAVSQSNKNEPYKHKPDVADASDAISPARAFLDEMLGVIAPTFRQLVLVHNITSSEMRLPPNTTSLTTQSYLDQKQQYLALLVDDCVQRYTPSKSINDRVGGEDDVGGRVDTMEISGSTTRPSISSLNGTPSTAHRQWQQPRITFELLLDIFNTIMDHRRSRTIDLSYRDDLCTHMRRMCLPLNLPECYAHVPNNMFERTYNSEQLENAFLPRPVFQARNEQWRQLELHQLESEPYIPFVARTYAKMCIMRTLGFINGEDQSWVDNYAIFHYQLDQLADRMSLDDSPFVLILGSCCYVRRGQRFFECSDARQAMLVWLLFVGADFPTHHRRLVTTCVSTATWISLLEQVIKNAVKSAASLQSRADETSANAQSTVRCSDMFDGNLLSDVLGEISSDDDAAHDDDNANTCNGGDSECEEEMLVKQYMQCDGFL